MIAFLKGTLEVKEPNRAVLDVNGVGYELSIPLSTYEKLPPVGERVILYTCQVVKEDELALFGFAEEEELKLFKMLIAVSGIGPRIALGILSKMSPAEFRLAIESEDVNALKSLPGVGVKTARRLILELKDKVGSLPLPAGAPKAAEAVRQAIAALVELGSPKSVAERAVGEAVKILGEEAKVEDLIRLALRFAV